MKKDFFFGGFFLGVHFKVLPHLNPSISYQSAKEIPLTSGKDTVAGLVEA